MTSGACTCTSPLPGLPPIPIRRVRGYARLSREAMDALFGRGSSLTVLRDLTQRPMFASNQTISLLGARRTISDIRVVGPVAEMTEIVLSQGVADAAGVDAPVRLPGDQDESGGGTLHGPVGKYDLDDGIIVLRSHVVLPRSIASAVGCPQGASLQSRLGGSTIAQGQPVVAASKVAAWIGGASPIVLPSLAVVIAEVSTPELLLDSGLYALAGAREGDVATLMPGQMAPEQSSQSRPGASAVITEEDVIRAHHAGRSLRSADGTIVTPAAQDADRRYHVIKSSTGG